MDRRDFLKASAPLGAAPFLLNGHMAQAFNSTSWLPAMMCEQIESRILVLIQLRGGNDGANTLIPINQYDAYANLRPDIRIPEADYINLDSTLAPEDQIGLHPSLTGFKELYDRGDMNIVQGVSYTQQNFSHFKSTELWLTGGDGLPDNFNLDDGWMARYLNYLYPGMAGNPTTANPDPLGIQIGQRKPSLGFHSEEQHTTAINLAGQDPNGFFTVLSELGGLPPDMIPDSDFGDQLQYVVDTVENANVYAERLAVTFDAGNNQVEYPQTYLADQLKTVAKLIDGGCQTKVYLVDLSGFDTHVDQVELGSPTVGWHSELLAELSDAVLAFQNDLAASSHQEQVLTVTFSEFGRKATQNDKVGTDHGNLAPMFVIGQPARGGVTGTNINFSNVDDTSGRFLDDFQFDNRQIFTTAIQDWLGIDDAGITATRFQDFIGQKVDILDPGAVVPIECYFGSLLPVELAFFNAVAENNDRVKLSWRTTSETNSDYFEVYRSKDGVNFEPLFKTPAAGNSTANIDYEEYDFSPLSGTSFYQLRQVDLDGQVNYFNIQKVDIFVTAKVKLYPNPAVYQVYIAITAPSDGQANLELYSLNGRLIARLRESVSAGFNKLELKVSTLPSGTYILKGFVSGSDGQKMKVAEKLIKT